MAFTIAVAGKGGVGKTTVAGFLVRWLVDKGLSPVLAVDADANSNLNEVLGLTVEETLGEAREGMKKGQSQGMTKNLFIEMKVNQCLVESRGFDLIAMGHPEGAGCYCAANHLLTECMDKLAENYRYLVVDNEAGLEHISRVTTQRADLFILVSDPSQRSLTAAQRAGELARDMGIIKGETHLILSMVRADPNALQVQNIARLGLDLAGWIPDDPELAGYDQGGKPTSELPPDNPAKAAAYAIFDRLLADQLPAAA